MNINLKNISTREEFAKAFDIPLKILTYVLYIKKPNNLYNTFKIPKKSGGEREINAPFGDLKDIQKKIAKRLYHYYFLENKKESKIAHAFIQGKSFITNAKIHKNKKWVLNLDLQDFYPSINFGRVRGFFAKNDLFLYGEEVATVMAQLTCHKGCLPQGAATSPVIANFIASILDHRILKLAKKYKCDYTRYADDLTFSSNYKGFFDQKESMLQELREIIETSGFIVNDRKTNIQNKESRQIVTGVVVNKKINVESKYYKKNRAILEHLYTGKDVYIDGEISSLSKIEGRLSFVNQVVEFNNINDNTKIKHDFNTLAGRELQYQKFLVYKYFFNNDKPLIVTEGKTDITYIKAALMNMADRYPALITKKDNNKFIFNIKFLRRTKRLKYFLNIYQDGASSLKSIYQFYIGDNNHKNYFEKFSKYCKAKFPVILLFDNETKTKDKPLKNFINSMKNNKAKLDNINVRLKQKIVENSNLYVLTHKLKDGAPESEIEDLFDDLTLNVQIDGKKFDRDTNRGNHDICFSKEIFSQYVLNNYQTIDFTGFIPLLNDIREIIDEVASNT